MPPTSVHHFALGVAAKHASGNPDQCQLNEHRRPHDGSSIAECHSSPSRDYSSSAGLFVLSVHSPGTARQTRVAGARARLAFRILGRTSLASVATSCRKLSATVVLGCASRSKCTLTPCSSIPPTWARHFALVAAMSGLTEKRSVECAWPCGAELLRPGFSSSPLNGLVISAFHSDPPLAAAPSLPVDSRPRTPYPHGVGWRGPWIHPHPPG